MMLATDLLLDTGAALLVAAAAHDVLARTIPNVLPALIACTGAGLHLFDGTLGPAALASLAVFTGTLACWRQGWMGGGDAKLLAAACLLLPPGNVIPALSAVALLGAVLALPYLAFNGRLARPPVAGRALPLHIRAWRAERFRLRRGGPLPYGAAIAAGISIVALGGAP